MIDEAAVTFAGARDRADRLRGDAEVLHALATAPAARTLPVWRGKPLFDVTGHAPRLGWLPRDLARLVEGGDPPALLGLEEGGAARFALDVSTWQDPTAPDGPPGSFRDDTRNSHPGLPEGLKFIDLRSIMAELDPVDAHDAATAKGVLEWHRTHPFCARCGRPTVMEFAGWRRACPDCGAKHFPRTDPVTIMLVTHGDRVLLGRQPFWPEGMYSLLAGFMEPGESIEAAARREVLEESGVPVGRVAYLASQPWPFPSSLMIAVACEALDDAIELDRDELEDAIWVPKAEAAEALAGRHPHLAPARHGAIARTVISAWTEGRSDPFG